jgi:hemerythrin-like domain-containing protein
VHYCNNYGGSAGFRLLPCWEEDAFIEAVSSTSKEKPTRMDAIALLKQDHREVRNLFRRFERSGLDAYKQQGDLAAKIVEELSRHAAIEEEIFYPMLRERFADDVSQEYVYEALEEHHAAKLMLAEIDRLSPEHERFRAKVMVLIESVEHHIEEEENTVFPELRRALSRKELNELGEAMARAKRRAPTRPHPHAPDEPPALPLVGAAAAVVDRARDASESALRRLTG